MPQSWNLSDKRCDSRHGEGDSWKIAVNSPSPGCAGGDGMLSDIIMACGNTAQSPRRLSQDTQPCALLCHIYKTHSFGNTICAGPCPVVYSGGATQR